MIKKLVGVVKKLVGLTKKLAGLTKSLKLKSDKGRVQIIKMEI